MNPEILRLKKQNSSLLIELGNVQLYSIKLEENIMELTEKLKKYDEQKENQKENLFNTTPKHSSKKDEHTVPC